MRKTTPAEILFHRLCFRLLDQTPPRFKVQLMGSAMNWEIKTTATTRGHFQMVVEKSIGMESVDLTRPHLPLTPFNNFLDSRGNQTTTPGLGLSQAPPSGGAQNGLVGLFNNATYGTIFKAFSAKRLFTPVGSNITNVLFFVPGSMGNTAATVKGFGAVFCDVDQPDGSGPGQKNGNRGSSTLVEFFGADGQLLYSSFVPPSPGDAGFSFFGITYSDARIASVRITAGDVPGPNDDDKNDIVMMDDFIYGEPQGIPQN